MDMTRDDILKKALLDTQEKVRDFMHYTQEIDDEELHVFVNRKRVHLSKRKRVHCIMCS